MATATTFLLARQAPRLRDEAIENNSLPQLQEALAHFREADSGKRYTEFVRSCLRMSVRAGHTGLVAYLLDNESEHIALCELANFMVAEGVSIPLLEVLVSHGWDINQCSTMRMGDADSPKRLIDNANVIRKEDVVVWLVEHGAIVHDESAEAGGGYSSPWPSPLLQKCAAFGSVKTFKYLSAHGAKMGKRTLHLAALTAAECGVDPSSAGTEEEENKPGETVKQERGDMLRYVVEELGLDVNAVADNDYPDDTGTPVCAAAHQKQGAAVVRWLLEKGADPTLATEEERDAAYCALVSGNEEAQRLIEAWKKHHPTK